MGHLTIEEFLTCIRRIVQIYILFNTTIQCYIQTIILNEHAIGESEASWATFFQMFIVLIQFI